MAVKRCLNCNAKTPLDAPACPECGATSFRYKCPDCGKVYSGDACPDCGSPIPSVQPTYRAKSSADDRAQRSSQQYTQVRSQPPARRSNSQLRNQHKPAASSAGIVCPRCGSDNFTISAVQTKGSISSRGCLWSIGRTLLIICTCGLWLLVGRAKGKVKYKNESVAVCQKCGKQWTVK